MNEESVGSVTFVYDKMRTGDDDAATELWQRFASQLAARARLRLKGRRSQSVVGPDDAVVDVLDTVFRRAREGTFPTIDSRRDLWKILLTITDRKKNVIFVSGFNVFPREIEELLLTHPAVSGACVVAGPHARSGEVPVAFVTLRDVSDEDKILAFCADHLIKYKQPSQIIILPEMPLSPAGKVDRMALAARLGEGANA